MKPNKLLMNGLVETLYRNFFLQKVDTIAYNEKLVYTND